MTARATWSERSTRATRRSTGQGFEATFEQSSVGGGDDARDVRLVFVKPSFTWPIDGTDHPAADHRLRGFARRVPAPAQDFERFVNQLDLAPG